MGGSQGARSINRAIKKMIDTLEANNLQLIWQTGKPYVEKARQVCAGRKNIWANDFITQMEYAYAAADVIISRSGAMSVSEICVVKKPVVFVPFPFAAEDHQTVNAKKLVDRNAAMMVKDSEAPEKLVPTIIALSKDEQKQNELRQNISKLAVTKADEIVAKEILKIVGA